MNRRARAKPAEAPGDVLQRGRGGRTDPGRLFNSVTHAGHDEPVRPSLAAGATVGDVIDRTAYLSPADLLVRNGRDAIAGMLRARSPIARSRARADVSFSSRCLIPPTSGTR